MFPSWCNCCVDILWKSQATVAFVPVGNQLFRFRTVISSWEAQNSSTWGVGTDPHSPEVSLHLHSSHTVLDSNVTCWLIPLALCSLLTSCHMWYVLPGKSVWVRFDLTDYHGDCVAWYGNVSLVWIDLQDILFYFFKRIRLALSHTVNPVISTFSLSPSCCVKFSLICWVGHQV